MTTMRTPTGTVTRREDGTAVLTRVDNQHSVFLHVELSSEEVAALRGDQEEGAQ